MPHSTFETSNSANRLAAKKEQDDSVRVDDLKRITEEYIDEYLAGDASWSEALSQEELSVLMGQLWAIITEKHYAYNPVALFSKDECKPYCEKVAKKLAQDRIDIGEA